MIHSLKHKEWILFGRKPCLVLTDFSSLVFNHSINLEIWAFMPHKKNYFYPRKQLPLIERVPYPPIFYYIPPYKPILPALRKITTPTLSFDARQKELCLKSLILIINTCCGFESRCSHINTYAEINIEIDWCINKLHFFKMIETIHRYINIFAFKKQYA